MTSKDSDLPYLDTFPTPANEAWRVAVDRVLKGRDFESTLVTRTADGIRIEPLYPAFTPSSLTLGRAPGRWHVAARLDHPDPTKANELAIADLEGGADTLVLSLAGAPGARGYGLVADDVAALDTALDGVMLDIMRLKLDPAPEGPINALLLAALVERRRLDASGLHVEFGLDPIGSLAVGGNLPAPWPEVGHRLGETVAALSGRGFRGPFVTVDTRPYHEAGASEAQELACAMATAIAYLRALEARGMTPTAARDALAFTFVADTDQFLTVAKLRAARLLWQRIQHACGLVPGPARIHAETAWRSLTKRDPNVNMLRGTIAAFSAGVGGADSMLVQPFTAALGLPDGFARRVARNTQLVLLDEANLWRVADPAAGAGGFEALTQALCETAWALMQEIESKARDGLPGMVAALVDGHVATTIASQRAARNKAAATRREPITGTSEFPNITEAKVAVLEVERPALLVEEFPGDAGVKEAGDLLTAFAGGARRAQARSSTAQGLVAPALPSCRLAESFERLRDRAEALPERPLVFLATLGAAAAFTTRAGFARNLFEAGGFAAPFASGFAGNGPTDVAALVVAFRESGAKLACLCGTDETYATEGPQAVAALVAVGATVWLAGRPGDNAPSLEVAGLAGSIQVGGDAIAALERAYDLQTAGKAA